MALLNRILTRDEIALGELYELCAEKVYQVTFSILKNTADSEEVTCDVFEYVWRKASFYSAQKSHVLSWILMISRSKSIDLMRQRKPASSLSGELVMMDIEDCDLKPDELITQFEANSVIHSQLMTLNNIQQQVISLAYFKDLSHQEISTVLQLPLGTVKSHIRRAISALHSMINKDN